MSSAQILFFFRGFFLFQVEMKDGYVTNYYSDTYPGLIVRLEFRRKLHYHLLQVSSCSLFNTFSEIFRDLSCTYLRLEFSIFADLLPKHNLPDNFLAGPVSTHCLFGREIGYGDDHHADPDGHVRY